VNYHLFHAGILRQKNLLVHTGQNGYLRLLVSKLSPKKKKSIGVSANPANPDFSAYLKIVIGVFVQTLRFCPM
jgi:hypothetical protein